MIRVIVGLIVFTIGAGSFFAAQSSPSGGTVWTGGMLVGAALVFLGARSKLERRKLAKAMAHGRGASGYSSLDVAVHQMIASPSPEDIAVMTLTQGWSPADRRRAIEAHLRKTGRLA